MSVTSLTNIVIRKDQPRGNGNSGHVAFQAITSVILIGMALEATGAIPTNLLPRIGVGVVAVQAGEFGKLETLAAFQAHDLVANVDAIVGIAFGPIAMAGGAECDQFFWLEAAWIARRAMSRRVISRAGVAAFALHSGLERRAPRLAACAVASKAELNGRLRLMHTERFSGRA
jgi:hypothetical protein